MTDEDIEAFKVGHSPANWNIPPEEESSETFGYHFPVNRSFLVDKIVIPNYSYNGEFAGLLTRSYQGPKMYRVWYKRQEMSHWNLFGFYQNQEAIRRKRSIVLVESFFDMIAIRPWVPNAVSTQTAFVSTIQLAFLKRSVNHVIFAYNDDFGKEYNTGVEATRKGKRLASNLGLRASAIELPRGVNDFSNLRELNPDLSNYFAQYYLTE